MNQENVYTELMREARLERRGLIIAMAFNPLVYAVAVLALVAVYYWYQAHGEHVAAQADLAAADQQRRLHNNYLYKLNDSQKGFVRYGVLYGSDGGGDYLTLRARDVKAYVSTCSGVLCVRVYKAVP